MKSGVVIFGVLIASFLSSLFVLEKELAAQEVSISAEDTRLSEDKIQKFKGDLAVAEQIHGKGHLETVRPLFDLAELYLESENYSLALSLFKQVLAIEEREYDNDN